MELLTYLSSLSIPNLFSRMPAAAAQGIIWGIMALGVYITFRLLNVSDLTVDGSFATGGAVTVMLLLRGLPAWAALLLAVAVGILTGEANVSEMPIEYYQNPVKKYDVARCEALGITVPADYVAIG